MNVVFHIPRHGTTSPLRSIISPVSKYIFIYTLADNIGNMVSIEACFSRAVTWSHLIVGIFVVEIFILGLKT